MDWLKSLEFGSLGDWVAVVIALIALILFLLAEWGKLKQWFIIRAAVYSIFLIGVLFVLLGLLIGVLGALIFFGVGWVMQNFEGIALEPLAFGYIGWRVLSRMGAGLGVLAGIFVGSQIAREEHNRG